jgi:hypothetical protein
MQLLSTFDITQANDFFSLNVITRTSMAEACTSIVN